MSNVTQTGFGFTVELSADEASRLAGVLALVADRSASQSIDSLYNKLLDEGVIDAGTAFFEENEDVEAIADFGEPEYFVVVT
jgi:hypothetical protein